MSEKQWVAGTIIAQNSENHSVFLVAKNEESFTFVTTEIEEERTGLASILEHFKLKMHIDMDALKLFELTNAVVDGHKIPLFVFELIHPAETLSEVLKTDAADLSWEKTATLQATMQKWEISGVPRFEKVQN